MRIPALRSGWLILRYSLRELARNPLGVLLLPVIPAVFVGMILLTASDAPLPLKVFLGEETLDVWLTQQEVGLVFVCAAVSGFLAAYYALVLFHNDFGYFRYCVFMGMDPSVFTVARFAAFLGVTALLAVGTTLGLAWVTELDHPLGVFAGFLSIIIIYGAYGGIVGIMSRSFMPALLLIVLLADLDAAWLQNPVYYSAAQDNTIIHWLPAFFPCQMVFASAFTDRVNEFAISGALVWGAGMVALLVGAVQLRMRGPLDTTSGRFDF